MSSVTVLEKSESPPNRLVLRRSLTHQRAVVADAMVSLACVDDASRTVADFWTLVHSERLDLFVLPGSF